MRRLSIAALLVGVMMTGCTSLEMEDAGLDKVVVTATITLDNGTATRALSTDGKKTFAVGDKIAVCYTNTSDATVKAVSKELDADDIKDAGKSARITVTLSEPKAGGTLKYIYPAAMANEDGTVNYDVLASQDGTLETLANTLDCCTFDGNLKDDGTLPATATLTNQLAIAKFVIYNSDSEDITSDITGLSVYDGTNSYSIVPVSPDAIYVALRPVEDVTFSFTAAGNASSLYVKTTTNKSLSASNIYPINLTMANSVPVVGHFLNKDGSITSTKQTDGADESFAVIAYVGAVEHYFDKFIALALTDVDDKGHGITDAFKCVKTYAGNHPITIGGTTYNTASDSYSDNVQSGLDIPSNTLTGDVVKGWRVPLVTDLRFIIQSLCGGPSATDPVGVTNGVSLVNGPTFVNKINDACGNTSMQQTIYQTASKGSYWWSFCFDSGRNKIWDYPDNGFRVRAVFAY